MNNESKLVIDLWDYLRDQISANKRLDCAIHILKLFEEHGLELNDPDLQGECEYLDEAVTMLSDEDRDDDYDPYEED